MNPEVLKTFKEGMGVAYTALDIDQHILQPEIITASDGCMFEILRPFFEGPWENWTDRDRFLTIAKEHNLEVEEEISGDVTITVGDTKIKLEWNRQTQWMVIYNERHRFSIQTVAAGLMGVGKTIAVVYNRRDPERHYYERALGDNHEMYLNDIRVIATLNRDIPIIKELIAQLLS